MDSATGQNVSDPDHITVELSGGPGRRRSHIYLGGHGSGVTAYDNIWVRGESVFVKAGKSYTLEPSLCTGDWAMAGSGGATGAGTASVTSAAYAAGSTAATGVGDGGSSYIYSDWEWDDHYQRYKRYNYTASEWEWQ
jgi:hypothetical protein